MGWRGGSAPQPVHGDDHRPARRAATAGLAGSGSAINIPLPPTPQSKSSSKHTVTSSNYGAFQDHLPAIVYTKPRGLCSIMGVSDLNPAQVEQALLPLGHGGMRLQQCSEGVADVARLSSVCRCLRLSGLKELRGSSTAQRCRRRDATGARARPQWSDSIPGISGSHVSAAA